MRHIRSKEYVPLLFTDFLNVISFWLTISFKQTILSLNSFTTNFLPPVPRLTFIPSPIFNEIHEVYHISPFVLSKTFPPIFHFEQLNKRSFPYFFLQSMCQEEDRHPLICQTLIHSLLHVWRHGSHFPLPVWLSRKGQIIKAFSTLVRPVRETTPVNHKWVNQRA